MDIDGQENQFEGDNRVLRPIEEMEKLKEFKLSGTILDSYDQDGKPKAIKESGQDIREDDHHPILRICDLCGKTFSGGKALGGHRRSHFQTKKARVGLSKNIKKNVAGADLRMDYDMIKGNRCSICHKDFPSKQSLFGHMRSHPERGWRGIQPPLALPSRRNSSISSSSASDSVDDHHNNSADKCMAASVDLLNSLSNWPQSDRRGRGNIGCAWAAEIIMSFSKEKDSSILKHSVSCKDQEVNDPSAVLEQQRMKKLKNHGSSTSGREGDHEEKKIVKNIPEGWMPGESSKDHRHQIGRKKMNKEIMKCWEQKFMRNSEMEELDRDLIDRTQKVMPYCYECSDCGKSFPTFQALGGHRSSHNKDKMPKSNNASSHEAASPEDQENTSANMNHRSWYRTGAEANSTGQSAAKIASKEASSTTQSGLRRLTKDFDLNKPHFKEDEDV